MSKIIPLHALVLVIHADPRRGVSEARRLFSPHEILTPQGIILDLVGQIDRPDLTAIAGAELRRRVALKLSLGERVVVVAPGLHRQDSRLALVREASSQGASIVYLIDDHTQQASLQEASPKDASLKAGDGLAHIVSMREISDVSQVVRPLQSNALPFLREHFRGITIIGDVHGHARALQSALSWARSRRHFVWFLGDVIDYGPDSLQTLETAYAIVMRGEGAFVLGNHERKIARWLAQQEAGPAAQSMKISEGNRVTMNALTQKPRETRLQWCGKFRSLLSRAALISHLGDVTMVHAAVHPDIWTARLPDQQRIEEYALYGEPNRDIRPPDFALSYRWVDAVPADKMVFVGHDVRSTLAPMVVTGQRGGRVIFLDTGAGKGGALSSADVRFTENGGLHLENFNRY